MPALLDVAIGTIFIFLLFSLVVSALNEYLLSLTDQRAKFLRMGLLELIGTATSAPAGFAKWLGNSLVTLGGLVEWKASPDPAVNGQNLLAHGLLNGFSRSVGGSGTPSYIPAGAFVTALLDVVVGPGAPAAQPATQAATVGQLITGIEAARPTAGGPLTYAAYDAPLLAFINAYSSLAQVPAPGSPAEQIHALVVDARKRAALQDALLAPAIAGFPAANALIALPAHAAYAPQLTALANSAAGVFPAFQQSVRDWFSLANSFNSLQLAAVGASTGLFAATAQLSAAQVLAGIEKLPAGKLKAALLSLFESTGRDVRQFKIAVEGWFNGVMDRVSGWYKRFAQKWMIVLGLLLAGIFNVDTIEIIRELSNNPILAKAVADQASTYLSDNGKPLAASELEERREKNLRAVKDAEDALKAAGDDVKKDPAKLKSLTDAVTNARAEAETLAAYQNAVKKLFSTGLPIGWTPEAKKKLGLQVEGDSPSSATAVPSIPSSEGGFKWRVLFGMIPGWFLTAIAASLGAPFWFDLLGRFINIRAAGRPPGEKETTSTPTRPPPASLDTTPGTRAPAQ